MKIGNFVKLFLCNLEILTFFRLARNLFLKLCKKNRNNRYDAHMALNHPWITRDPYSKIPMTLIDSFNKQTLIKNFKKVKF